MCNADGGDFPVIADSDMQLFLYEIVQNERGCDYWVGLENGDLNGNFKWVDGTLMVAGYTNWSPQGIDEDKDCVVMMETENFKWFGKQCTEHYCYICRFSQTGPTTQPTSTVVMPTTRESTLAMPTSPPAAVSTTTQSPNSVSNGVSSMASVSPSSLTSTETYTNTSGQSLSKIFTSTVENYEETEDELLRRLPSYVFGGVLISIVTVVMVIDFICLIKSSCQNPVTKTNAVLLENIEK
ncbi:uncharacterized protein [Ptychodera flava]|uniref:uncharacterized protein n=1 Tax=Ptychodera flava TaxID=63121 RepID=UPI00396A2BEE